MGNRKFLPILLIGGIALIVIVALSNSIFLTIQAGEAGVIFRKFSGGLDKENVYQQGFQVIAPWNTMFVYDIKQQTAEESHGNIDIN